MESRIYTVEQVAGMLELHPRTIRRYIREEKLKANKIGGQWRIRDIDLNCLMENEERRISARGDASSRHPVKDEFTVDRPDKEEQMKLEAGSSNQGNQRKGEAIRVSAVVDVYHDEQEAARISNTIVAVLNCKEPDYGPVKYNHLYYREEGKARYIFWGSPRFISVIMRTFAEIAEAEEFTEAE